MRSRVGEVARAGSPGTRHRAPMTLALIRRIQWHVDPSHRRRFLLCGFAHLIRRAFAGLRRLANDLAADIPEILGSLFLNPSCLEV
jgi:hypothetical protein